LEKEPEIEIPIKDSPGIGKKHSKRK
jgi:hypothetical protein